MLTHPHTTAILVHEEATVQMVPNWRDNNSFSTLTSIWLAYVSIQCNHWAQQGMLRLCIFYMKTYMHSVNCVSLFVYVCCLITIPLPNILNISSRSIVPPLVYQDHIVWGTAWQIWQSTVNSYPAPVLRLEHVCCGCNTSILSWSIACYLKCPGYYKPEECNSEHLIFNNSYCIRNIHHGTRTCSYSTAVCVLFSTCKSPKSRSIVEYQFWRPRSAQ